MTKTFFRALVTGGYSGEAIIDTVKLQPIQLLEVRFLALLDGEGKTRLETDEVGFVAFTSAFTLAPVAWGVGDEFWATGEMGFVQLKLVGNAMRRVQTLRHRTRTHIVATASGLAKRHPKSPAWRRLTAAFLADELTFDQFVKRELALMARWQDIVPRESLVQRQNALQAELTRNLEAIAPSLPLVQAPREVHRLQLGGHDAVYPKTTVSDHALARDPNYQRMVLGRIMRQAAYRKQHGIATPVPSETTEGRR
ncbi:hypothetical protein [Lacticaseibacillus parakribbianus]|uniref:hypothetical protein n=1 Tax=Lacticaseibacillus parakribbianus TaxID=2970927 RepID=UPI0021CAF0C9|nr:hypothetical protein [Lacticaseibacillus parakribbianus]